MKRQLLFILVCLFVLNYTSAEIPFNDFNFAPTDITLSSEAINENKSSGTTVGTLSSTDADFGDTFTYTLVAGIGDADNASFSVSGSDLLSAASFNHEMKDSYSIRVRTTDANGLWYEEEFTITVNDINEIPTDSALTSTNINENESSGTTVGALSTTDVDDGDTFTYTLVAGTGDTNNASFSILGSDLLSGASFNHEIKDSYSIRIQTTDANGLSYAQGFIITVNDVNEIPTDIALSSTDINENESSGTTVGTLSTTDVDDGDTSSYTLVAGVGDTNNGSFSISGSSLLSGASFDYETKDSYSIRIRTADANGLSYDETFTINVNDVNDTPTDMVLSLTNIDENEASGTTIGALSTTDADAVDSFTYTLVAGTGDTDNGSFSISGSDLLSAAIFDHETQDSYSIRVRTTDDNGLFYEETFTITVNDINETPTDSALSSTNIDENESSGTTVGTLSTADVDDGDTFTYTLVAGTGDTDNASFSISGADLLSIPIFDHETKDSYAIRVRTTDNNGLFYEKTFTITVNDINETPTDSALSSTDIDENEASGTTVGALSTTDIDDGDTFTYTLVAGTGDTNNGSFSISGSNLLSGASFNHETKDSYSVRVQTTDSNGLSYAQSFIITINDINETSTDIALSSADIDENEASGTTVGDLSTTDEDDGDTFTYTLVAGTGDTNNGSFSISGSNLLSGASFNHETKDSYSIRVRSTDVNGLSYDEAFTITVNNVNETPTDMVLSSTDINENEASGTTVGTLSTADVDDGDTFTYTLVAGTGDTDNASFSISNSNLLSDAIFDHEIQDSYSIRVRTTDTNGLSYDESFTITINDINETPTDIILSSTEIDDDQVSGTTVGTLSTADVDDGDTFTYTLVSGTGDTDNGLFNITANGLLSATAFDYNAKSTYSIRVRTTDSGILTFDKEFTITINDKTSPVISNVRMSTSNTNVAFAKVGDVITLSFDSDETINAPTVFIASEPASVSNPSGNSWIATLTVGLASIEGLAAFNISNISDDDNNAALDVAILSSGNAIEIDRTAPTGYGVSSVLDPVNIDNQTAFTFNITGLENTSTYNWTVTDVNNASVSGNGSTNGANPISISTNVSSLADGALTVTVSSTDAAGNLGLNETGNSDKNTVRPVITLLGDNPQIIDVNTVYIELGATANDDIDGDITGTININSSAINLTVVGCYPIIYTVLDSHGNSGQETRIVFVLDPGKPWAKNDSYTVNENSQNNMLAIIGNDSYGTNGPNPNHPIAISGAYTDNGAKIDLVGNQIQYTPRTNFTGVDSFSYTITDDNGNGSGDGASATVTVTVTAATVNISAVADTANAVQGSNDVVVIDVLANDTYGSAAAHATESLTLPSLTSTEGATLSVVNGTIGYVASALFAGPTDTFNYTIKDVNNATSTATVTVTIGAADSVNGVPSAKSDSFSVVQNTMTSLAILANNGSGVDTYGTDGAHPTGALTFINGTTSSKSVKQIESGNAANNIIVNGTEIEYTPVTGFTGSDSFYYMITDGSGDTSIAQVMITVTEVASPTANDDAATVAAGTLVAKTIDVLANDSFGSDGPGVTPLAITNVNGSTSTLNIVDSKVTYIPDAALVDGDTETIEYTITDGSGDTTTAEITITIGAGTSTNDTPTAKDDAVTVAQNSIDNVISILLNNGNGADDYGIDLANANHPISLSAFFTDNGGELELVGETVLYTPRTNFTGVDTFGYIITDGSGDGASATVTVTVTAATVNISAVADTANAVQGSNDVVVIDVLANDTYGSAAAHATESLTLPSLTSTEGATLSVVNGTIGYVASALFAGPTDTFNYTIKDVNNATSTATVTVTIGAADSVNGVPSAKSDSFSVVQNTMTSLAILANNGSGVDTYGTDGAHPTGALTFINGTTSSKSVKQIESGNAANNIIVNGTEIEYTPVTGFTGSDSFYYMITDGSGDTSIAQVMITVTEVASPTANDDAATVAAGTLVAKTIDVLANDSFGSDGPGVTPLAITNVNGSTSTLNIVDSKVTYIPDAALVDGDTETIEYTITDGSGDTTTAEITITIGAGTSTNDTPTANDDAVTVLRNSTNNDIFILLDNGNGADDYGADLAHPNHSISPLPGATDIGGTLVLDGNKVVYTPKLNFTGVDTFNYTITDGNGDSDTATVTITVAVAKNSTDDFNSSQIKELQVSPNPTSGNINVRLYSSKAAQATIVLFDVTGKVVYKSKQDLTEGNNTLNFDVISKSGILLLKVYTDKTNYGTKKIIFK